MNKITLIEAANILQVKSPAKFKEVYKTAPIFRDGNEKYTTREFVDDILERKKYYPKSQARKIIASGSCY